VADAIRFVSSGVSAPGINYVHADHLGAPQKMTDANQALVWDAVYTPFGQVHSITGTATNNQRFPGQYADAETGYHQNWFRDYEPSLGRYIQSDPIGLRGGLNTYGYVGGNPIIRTDPWGLIPPSSIPNFGENSGPLFGSVEGHLFGGGGIARVTCCTEDGARRTMVFVKVCVGSTVGFSAVGGPVAGLTGKKCDPKNYSGYFVEASGGIGGASVGVDIGIESGDSPFDMPTGFSGTNEIGFGVGTPGFGISLCWYQLVKSEREPCGCNK